MRRRRDELGSVRHVVIALGVVVALAAATALAVGFVPELRQHDASPPPTPLLRLATPAPAAAVLGPTRSTPPGAAEFAGLEQVIAPLLHAPGFGGRVGFAMASLADPTERWQSGATRVMPASTMKLLTTTAALDVLGPEHRFTTSVVRGSTPGSVVLVGGGDPLLAGATPTGQVAAASYPLPASLQQLAALTAARLLADGTTSVHLGYDTTLFAGPAVNPRWPSDYVPEDVVSPIQALWVNEGRVNPGLEERSADPALAAAHAFATFLARDKITVTGAVSDDRRPIGTRQAPLAMVRSAPLREVIQHILELSDNEGAEVLLRQVAIAAGRPGTSVAGVSAVRAVLGRLGLDLSGATFYDGSGLSRDDVIPVSLLLHVLELDASPAHPALRAVVTGLPVAGFTGSLAYRFVDDAPGGDGYVHAKTGTLTGVSGLAGIALTRTGVPLVFVAVADRVPVPDTLDARADLDQVGAALVACGCAPGPRTG